MFTNRLRAMRQLLAPCATALLLAGCAQVTGGGHMRSADTPEAKATFALSLVCQESGYLAGHWVYHDHGSQPRVNVHGPVSESNGLTCDQQATEPGGRGTWLGLPYISQGPTPRQRGSADIEAVDGNKGGPARIKGDFLSITLRRASDGRIWYRNSGRVRGGNLTIIRPE